MNDQQKQYNIKEMFYTLQGEGAHAGRPAVFCRFSKCNLWNGRESSRENAICNFCDTDFIGTDGINGGTYLAEELVKKATGLWPTPTVQSNGLAQSTEGRPYLVCTGGEPLLQLDQSLVELFKKAGFEVAVETNGTLPLVDGIDWVCLSPKGKSKIVIHQCDELKLVYPQQDALPEQFLGVQANHYYLQPMADYTPLITSDKKKSPDAADTHLKAARQSLDRSTTAATVQYCLEHPQWKLSLQSHKWLEID